MQFFEKWQNDLGGRITDDPLASVATQFNSAALSSISGGVSSAGHEFMRIVLDPFGRWGAPEICYITDLTSGATVTGAAGLLRAQEGTAARQHRKKTLWVATPITKEKLDRGGFFWKPNFCDPLTAIAGWTARDGTWAADAGGFVKQTDTAGGNYRELRYDTEKRFHEVWAECEIRVPSAGQPAISPHSAGIVVEWNGNDAMGNAIIGFLSVHDTTPASSNVEVQLGDAVNGTSYTANLAEDVWYRLGLHVSGGAATIYVDGVEKGAQFYANGLAAVYHVGLVTVEGIAHFRNFKLWTPAQPR